MATHVNDFGTGSVKKRILSQAIPLMMAQAVQLLYNVVDRIYIGHLKDIGDIAMTGLGITFPVIVIIASFTSLYGSGGTVLFSIERGRGNKEEAEKILGNVVALHLVSAIVLFLFCYLLKRPILYLFGASDQSIIYADQYIRIYLFGTLFSMLSTGLNGFINAQGHPRVGMMTTIIGAIVNIILDPVFIFLLKMGVAGAAVATVLSQAVSVIWVLHYLLSYDTELRIKKEYVTIDGRRTKEIVTLGFPGFVMQATGGLVQIASNNQLQIYGGDMYVTIFTILNSIRDIIQLPVYALTSGASPVLGYNYGAEKYERVKEAIRFTTVFSGLYTIVAWLIIVFEPHLFMGMFSNNPITI
ncbi:MAG: MATE family efflux transporter, partial [Clostridiales bacterium]|nr:MATE family efflux transporter [Clostridiales bacterium]